MLSPIAAIATAPGRGGIGVVRISGKDLAPVIAGRMRQAAQLQPRHATYLPFLDADGSVIDHGLAIYFKAPHSYTGEDVLELQGHGGPVVMQMLLARCLEAGRRIGLRLAQPGEFTQRAFLNDKLDLAQAEAVADLIDAIDRSGGQVGVAIVVRRLFQTRSMHWSRKSSTCACWSKPRSIFRKRKSTSSRQSDARGQLDRHPHRAGATCSRRPRRARCCAKA